MTIAILSAEHMSDQQLLDHVRRAATCERRSTVQLIAFLAELDARKLYLGEGCASLFTYCRQVLHLSEHAAYGRIEAARAARRFPVILEGLAEGALNLASIGLLAAHLTPANHHEVLEAARHKSKREIEELVARLRPKPDVPSSVRRPPQREQRAIAPDAEMPGNDDEVGAAAAPIIQASTPVRPEVKPLAPERYKIQFTVSRETYERLRLAQDLLRHTIPTGDPGAIFERALTLLVDDLAKSKLAATTHPRATRTPSAGSRTVPASVRRAVWKRDGGRCAFKGAAGRCTETAWLELHHVVPFAKGGETTIQNVELRCRSHNAYEAEQKFGPRQPRLLREMREVYQVDG